MADDSSDSNALGQDCEAQTDVSIAMHDTPCSVVLSSALPTFSQFVPSVDAESPETKMPLTFEVVEDEACPTPAVLFPQVCEFSGHVAGDEVQGSAALPGPLRCPSSCGIGVAMPIDDEVKVGDIDDAFDDDDDDDICDADELRLSEHTDDSASFDEDNAKLEGHDD